MQPTNRKEPRYIEYIILKYGGLLAVGILGMGSILSGMTGMQHPAHCSSLSDIFLGIIGFQAMCWFVLGLIVLMSIPVVALLIIFLFSIFDRDRYLTFISLFISALLLFATFYAG